MELNKNLKNKLDQLINFLEGKKIIVAFSGGVDSSLLAYLSKIYAKKTLLITASSEIFTEKELWDAKEFAKNYDINHILLDYDILDDEDFKKNPVNRCYICKKYLFSEIIKIKNDNDYDLIVEGTNSTELDDFRPGYRALKELGISSPYLNFNLNKTEIRNLCEYFNLEVSSKPSNACLASRVSYNINLKGDLIEKIKDAEEFLKTKFNLNQVRVRYHENNLIRIEFLLNDLHRILNKQNVKTIINEFKKYNFDYITIDLEGYISGSMNKTL